MDLSKFYTISHTPEQSLMTITWKPESENMEYEDFKNILLGILEFIKEYKPLWYIADSKHYSYPIVPSLQDWSNSDFLPKIYELGVKKMAIITSEDFITRISVSQALNESTEEVKTKTANFATFEECLVWFNEN